MGRKRKNKWKSKVKKYAIGIAIACFLAVLCLACGVSDVNEISNGVSDTVKTISEKISETWENDNDTESEETTEMVTTVVTRHIRNAFNRCRTR